jgi:preprotein translocase subunit SecA
MVTRSIERAQKQVEARNFEIRKHLLQYDDVMNRQREAVYSLRRRILEGLEGREWVLRAAGEIVGSLIDTYCPEDKDPEEWDRTGLEHELENYFGLGLAAADVSWEEATRARLEEALVAAVEARFEQREQALGKEAFDQLTRYLMLSVLDAQWKDHLLALDHLKEGIGMRAYGQRDPLVEYKRESFGLFQDMMERIEDQVVQYLFRVELVERVPERRRVTPVRATKQEASALAGQRPEAERSPAAGPPTTVRRSMPKVGRNDPCPCGSGKKYKKCHGAVANLSE